MKQAIQQVITLVPSYVYFVAIVGMTVVYGLAQLQQLKG